MPYFLLLFSSHGDNCIPVSFQKQTHEDYVEHKRHKVETQEQYLKSCLRQGIHSILLCCKITAASSDATNEFRTFNI